MAEHAPFINGHRRGILKATPGEAIAARIQKVENGWDSPDHDSLVKEMLSSRVSRWLQHQRTLNPWLLKVIVADETGATVAAMPAKVEKWSAACLLLEHPTFTVFAR